jgi:flagellin-like protein
MRTKLRRVFGSGEDRAVSPVIGVILMVAITVILAAVIGTFVLGLGKDIQTGVQAGANVDYDASGDKISSTYVSSQNAAKIEVRVYDSSGAQVGSVKETSDLGTRVVFTTTDGLSDNSTYDVVVTAVDSEGQSTVIYDDSGSI